MSTPHPLQPAIDVCPTDEDAALVAVAPALLKAIRDIARYDGECRNGQYDLATVAVRTAVRLLKLRDEMAATCNARGLPLVSLFQQGS